MDAAKNVTANFTLAPISGVGCVIPRSSGGAPVYSATHPKVLLNHAPTLACLRQMKANNTAAYVRIKGIVDAEYAHAGTTTPYEQWWSALIYQLTGDTKYAHMAIDRLDAMVAGEEALIAGGHPAGITSDSFLYAGGFMTELSLVYDWCYDYMTPTQRTRWIAYMNQTVFNIWNNTSGKWGATNYTWSGWATNDPYNNYYFGFMRATMMLGLATNGENASASTWITKFRTTEFANNLVANFNGIGSDPGMIGGGSREGTGYGTSMRGLFQLYDWWERSTGERIATLTPHTLASMSWLTHNMVPTMKYLTPVGDAARDASVSFYDYHRTYLLALISLFPQERLTPIAKQLLDQTTLTKMVKPENAMDDFLYEPPTMAGASVQDVKTTYFGAGSSQLLMRSAWGDTSAAFASFACGPYTESHAHHDQSGFLIFRGEWLAPTANIYSHSGIQQADEFNNLVRVKVGGNTIQQVAGYNCSMLTVADNDNYTYGVANVKPVYGGNASITKDEREFLFIKPSTFVVFDRLVTASGASRVWTLNLPGAPTVNASKLTYTGTTGNKLDVFQVAPAGIGFSVNPVVMGGAGELENANAKRVEVVHSTGTTTNFLHVLGTNSSVSTVLPADATGQTGVQITLADGTVATVRFANDRSVSSTSSTLTITKPGVATPVVSGVLPTGVAAIPIFKN